MVLEISRQYANVILSALRKKEAETTEQLKRLTKEGGPADYQRCLRRDLAVIQTIAGHIENKMLQE